MIGILPCSGSCNVGQLATKAVVRAMEERPGQVGFVCALGLPLQIPGIVKKARENYRVHVGLDGCSVGCATKALQSIGVELASSITVAEASCLEKSEDLRDETGLDKLVALVAAEVDRLGAGRA